MAPIRPRAPDGSDQARFLMSMDRALRVALGKAAAADGVSVTEWVRQAIRERLARHRQTSDTPSR